MPLLRYALGITAAMALAMGVAWPLCFLVPVLVQGMLGPGVPRLPLRAAASMIVLVAVVCTLGMWVSTALLMVPSAYVPFLALALFWTFYSRRGGMPPFVVTSLLIALTVVPMLAMQSGALTVGVIQGLLVGIGLALLLANMMHGLLPDPSAAAPGAAAPGPQQPPSATSAVDALLSTAVVLPVATLFLLYEMTGSLVSLVFVAQLAQQLDPTADPRAGKVLIATNLVGGLCAIAAYEVLVLVPSYPFLLLLVLLLALLFGGRLFSGTRSAPMFGTAFSTVLLILGSTTTSTTEADLKAYTRILQLGAAVLYVGGASWLISLWRRKGTPS